MKYTIKDLTEGRVAVKNDGTLEELMEVLGKAFSGNNDTSASYTYYERCKNYDDWDCGSSTDLPSVSVKDLLEWKPVRGEKVLVSNDNVIYESRIYLATIEGANYPVMCVDRSCEAIFISGNRFSTRGWTYVKRIEEPKEVRMTVAEIEEKLGISNLKITK